MKLWRYTDGANRPIGWTHRCPGCAAMHIFNVEEPTRPYPEYNIKGGAIWRFDGNEEAPTFTPSMHVQAGGWKRPDGTLVPRRTLCHYLLTKGVLQFLADSGHQLAGKSVPLPELTADDLLGFQA